MSIPYQYRPAEIVAEGGLRQGLNSTGSTITAGHYVSGYEGAITVPAATTSPIYGVTRHDVPTAQRGNLIQSGRAVLIVGATPVVAGNQVMPEATTGCAIPFTTGNSNGGLAQTGGSAGQEIMVDLDAGLTAQ